MTDIRDLPAADPGLVRHLEELHQAQAPSAEERGVEELRRLLTERAAARPKGPELDRVEALFAAGDDPIPVRLYRPTEEALGLLVFFHGGGWTIGDLDSHDRLCRRIAVEAGVAVLAVGYRLAPEHRWPAGSDDALAVVRWVHAQPTELGEITAVAVGGDSAGAALAALVCLRLRDDGDPLPALQVLINPHLDLTGGSNSMSEKATGWGLSAADALWFASQWAPDPELRKDPRVSVVFEPDLTGLPPAIVVTAEHDPLRDEGDLYAQRLAEAGVEVIHRCEPHMTHGFMSLDLVSTTAAATHDRLFADIARSLRSG